jgi:hypothetical protein
VKALVAPIGGALRGVAAVVTFSPASAEAASGLLQVMWRGCTPARAPIRPATGVGESAASDRRHYFVGRGPRAAGVSRD